MRAYSHQCHIPRTFDGDVIKTRSGRRKCVAERSKVQTEVGEKGASARGLRLHEESLGFLDAKCQMRVRFKELTFD